MHSQYFRPSTTCRVFCYRTAISWAATYVEYLYDREAQSTALEDYSPIVVTYQQLTAPLHLHRIIIDHVVDFIWCEVLFAAVAVAVSGRLPQSTFYLT